MENTYLVHYGIKGMRWGVRRYQNEDGTLTSAGRRRQSNEETYKKLEGLAKKEVNYTTKTKIYSKQKDGSVKLEKTATKNYQKHYQKRIERAAKK